MSNIGKPTDYFDGQISNDPNAHNTGGYVEERLSKLEFYQKELKIDMINIKLGYCLCCKLPMQLTFPICTDCVEILGKITSAKRDQKFMF